MQYTALIQINIFCANIYQKAVSLHEAHLASSGLQNFLSLFTVQTTQLDLPLGRND